ncbi:type III secretion system translocon subunit SctE [Burkholderia ubonensis]|uniref:type III secretion system translocon subunit SctE n=1 Tax=Burkholderia ubonensis TaxID=101571 RepID=UPI0008FEAAFB|nr:type III secretion system translocon subunit SctE [Burkholderia ubonensis]OJA86352.1 translocator protein BipB [Burkholderia ubonensis]
MTAGTSGGTTANTNPFQTHRLRDAAGALGTMSPDAFLSVVLSATNDFLAQMANVASRSGSDGRVEGAGSLDDAPQLQVPSGNERSPSSESLNRQGHIGSDRDINGAAKLTELMGALMSIISASDVQRLKERSDIWNLMSKAEQENLNQLSDQYQQAIEDAKSATEAADSAKKAADQASDDAKKADDAEAAAQKAYDDAVKNKASDDDIKSLSDVLNKAKQEAKDKHDTAEQLKNDASQKLDDATKKGKAATESEKKAVDAANQAVSKRHVDSALGVTAKPKLSGEAELTAVLGKLQDLISSSSVKELQSKQKLFNEMQAKREADLKKKSDEYQEQVKKAEEMQKTMGCIGKIVGWIITAVSFAAAAFTGGASLALAAVGLALAVGDQICKAATGVSFMDKMMQPIMDAILKPLMSAISSVITKALVACGVDKQQAELAGAIIGAVATGAALVAAAFVGASAVKAIASKVIDAVAGQLTKLMDNAIGKMLTEMVENFTEKSGIESLAGKITTGFSRLRRSVGVETEEDAMLMSNRFEKASTVLNTGNQVAQAAGDIAVGVERNKAMHLLADIKEAMSDIKFLGDLLKQAIERFAESLHTLTQLMRAASDANAAEMSTGKLILRNARAV